MDAEKDAARCCFGAASPPQLFAAMLGGHLAKATKAPVRRMNTCFAQCPCLGGVAELSELRALRAAVVFYGAGGLDGGHAERKARGGRGAAAGGADGEEI